MSHFSRSATARYVPIASEDDSLEGADAESANSLALPVRQSIRQYARECWRQSARPSPVSVVLILVSGILFAVSGWNVSGTWWHGGRTRANIRATSYYSPIFDEMDIILEEKRMEATLLQPEVPTIFRMDPSPEVDAAWHRISETKPMVISKEDVIALGKDVNRAAKWPERLGFGPEAYIGRIDVFHQIHCLDALRREAHFDYYYGHKYPGGLNTTTPLHKLHLSHCLYLLLQNLMCTANVDIYTHFWTDTLPAPQPDFNIWHECRNFDAILDWQTENGVSDDEFFALRRPADYGPPQRMSRKYKELWNFTSDRLDHLDGDGVA